MCSSCKYLDTKDKKEGKVNGCMYYCKKNKKYCYSSIICSSYEEDKKRNKFDVAIITEDLRECDNMTVGSGLFILAFMIILFIITKLI